MGFFEFIKKLIYKEKETAMVNPGDIVSIPDRNSYKDNIEMINLIDSCKDKYLELLSQKRTLTTIDLKFDDLQENMIMNVDLLLDSIAIDDFFILAPEELTIQAEKLKLYFSSINEMENETIARIIALKELRENKRIPRRNRNRIIDLINNLSNSLIIYNGQKFAILEEMRSFFNMISINTSGIDNDLFEQKYKKLAFISSAIISDDENVTDDLVKKIAFLEKCIEIYVYKNKNEIKELDEEFSKLCSIVMNRRNKRELLDKITNLEKKYLLFYDYGKDLVSEEQIKKLYRVKFNILTSDIDYLRESPIDKDDYGYSYYKDIVAEKLEEILTGKNDNFNKTFRANELDIALNIIKEYFKDGSDIFDIDKILCDKFKLNLLLAFDRINGFSEMLENNVILNSDNLKNPNIFEQDLLSKPHDCWADKVPLMSYFSVLPKPSEEAESYKKWPLYDLFSLTEDRLFTSLCKFYPIPEGIKYLDRERFPFQSIKKISEKVGGKLAIMPSTLEGISGNVFFYNHSDIKLNEGLRFIGDGSFLRLDNSGIVIPSSVERITGKNVFNRDKLSTIYFKDFKNSGLLHDKEALVELFDSLFYPKRVKDHYHYVSDEVKKMQREYHEGRRSYFANYQLFEHDGWVYETKSVSDLDSIVLQDDDEKIKIHTDELAIPCIPEFDGYKINGSAMADKLQEVILKRTGHDIFNDGYQKVLKS